MSHGAIPTVGINDVPDPLPPDLKVLDVRDADGGDGAVAHVLLLGVQEAFSRGYFSSRDIRLSASGLPPV